MYGSIEGTMRRTVIHLALIALSLTLGFGLAAMSLSQGRAAVDPTPGRFTSALTKDELADFAFQRLDPQKYMEAQVDNVRTLARRSREAAATAAISDNALSILSPEEVKKAAVCLIL